MSDIKIHPALYLDHSPEKGRGVFTNIDLNPMTVIEISSVLVLNPEERLLLEKTELNNYIFEWGTDNKSCCVAWGYVSMYNHDFKSNCEYYMDYEQQIITIKTVQAVAAGEELTINYNGDWDNTQQLWFPVR